MENNRTVELIHVACCFFNHKNIALLKLIKLEPLSTAATPVYSTRLPLHFEMYKKNSFIRKSFYHFILYIFLKYLIVTRASSPEPALVSAARALSPPLAG